MSRALQKYADRRGIAIQQAGQEEEGDTMRGQMAVAGEQAQDQIDQSKLRIPFEKGETISGISLGGGLTVGKLGSKLQSFVKTGKNVLSSADSAASRASNIARTTGGDSVADGIDAARSAGRRIATRVGDGATSLNDASKGVTQASRSGLETAMSNASNVNDDLVRLAPDSTRIAGESSSLTNNISRSVTGSDSVLNAPVSTDATLPGGSGESRGLFGRLFGKKAPVEAELPDETDRLADIRQATYTDEDFQTYGSNLNRPTIDPSLTAPDRAVTDSGRSIEDVSKAFSSQSADDLIAGGTDAGRVARGVTTATRSDALLGGLRGDSTLARVGADNPFSFRNQGVSEADLGGAPKTSKFGDVLQTQPEEVPPPLEGTQITSTRPAPAIAGTQPRAQPPAQPDTLDPNAGASGGQASKSNIGRNGGTSEADAQSKATSSQVDSGLDQQIDKANTELSGPEKLPGDSKFMDDMDGGADTGAGEGAEALSIGDKFLKYGGAALEAVGVLGDLAGVGYGIYELAQIPEEQKELNKEQSKLTTAVNAEATPGKVTYGDIAGATLNTAPTAEGGTFSHF